MASIIFRTTNDRTKMPLERDLEQAIEGMKENGSLSFFLRWLLNYAWKAGAREEFLKGDTPISKISLFEKEPKERVVSKATNKATEAQDNWMDELDDFGT